MTPGALSGTMSCYKPTHRPDDLGGGIIRDLLPGLRSVAVTSHHYLPTITVAAVARYLFAAVLRGSGTPFVVLDAMATGLFTVAGAEKPGSAICPAFRRSSSVSPPASMAAWSST